MNGKDYSCSERISEGQKKEMTPYRSFIELTALYGLKISVILFLILAFVFLAVFYTRLSVFVFNFWKQFVKTLGGTNETKLK